MTSCRPRSCTCPLLSERIGSDGQRRMQIPTRERVVRCTAHASPAIGECNGVLNQETKERKRRGMCVHGCVHGTQKNLIV